MSTFWIYFLIMLKYKENTTWLVVIMKPQLLVQIKSAITSDLMILSTLFILVICLEDIAIILAELDKLIETNICLLEGFLVVMLNLNFFFLDLLIICCISLIFLVSKFRKFFLIFITFLMLANNTWAYKQPFELLLFLLVFFYFSITTFDFSKTFILGLSRIERKILEISASLLILFTSFFLLETFNRVFSLNWAKIHYWKVILLIPTDNISHLTL